MKTKNKKLDRTPENVEKTQGCEERVGLCQTHLAAESLGYPFIFMSCVCHTDLPVRSRLNPKVFTVRSLQ